MKGFKFRYSKTVWVLLCIVVILSVTGLCWNIFNMINADGNTLNLISSAIIAVLSLIITVFVISVMVYGRYAVDKKYLYSYFGFIKSKTPITDIIGITHFKKSDKLVVYFKTEEYTVIVISPDEYERFILSVREVNPAVTFDAQIDGEDTPE